MVGDRQGRQAVKRAESMVGDRQEDRQSNGQNAWLGIDRRTGSQTDRKQGWGQAGGQAVKRTESMVGDRQGRQVGRKKVSK